MENFSITSGSLTAAGPWIIMPKTLSFLSFSLASLAISRKRKMYIKYGQKHAQNTVNLYYMSINTYVKHIYMAFLRLRFTMSFDTQYIIT